jgi:hypothetical protein
MAGGRRGLGLTGIGQNAADGFNRMAGSLVQGTVFTAWWWGEAAAR